MQLYALEEERPILAHEAKKQKNYRCPECLSPLRLREGPHRQAHFYHLKTQTLCRQHNKSLVHLRLQLLLSRRLAGSRIERPFPKIGRIADVSWESEKIIFEIQCSPISLNEAKERCRDYKQLGLNVVWILHDRQFNKKTVSEAEAFLRMQPCYFVGDQEIFYDQFDIIQGARRLFKGPPLPVNLGVYLPQKITDAEHPKILHFRAKHHPLYFQGDLSDNLFQSQGFALLKQLEKRYAASHPLPWVAAIKKLYGGLLRLLLDLDS